MTTRDKQITARKGALGKGITSLLGDLDAVETRPREEIKTSHQGLGAEMKFNAQPGQDFAQYKDRVVYLPIETIEPNPHQPRRVFNEKALQDLANSIRVDGVLQPIVVSLQGASSPKKYLLIAGERRLRASQRAGKMTIPAIIKEGTAEDLLRLALIENIQRSDLNILEEAEAYHSLIRDFGLTQEQCAEKVGKERSTVANALRLLTLPREVQDDLVEDRMTMGHGRALLSLEDKKQLLKARDIVIKKQLSVRETEQLCKRIKDELLKPQDDEAPKNQPDLDYIAESLRSFLKTKVKLAGTGSRGKIEISYFSALELERILNAIGHKFV